MQSSGWQQLMQMPAAQRCSAQLNPPCSASWSHWHKPPVADEMPKSHRCPRALSLTLPPSDGLNPRSPLQPRWHREKIKGELRLPQGSDHFIKRFPDELCFDSNGVVCLNESPPSTPCKWLDSKVTSTVIGWTRPLIVNKNQKHKPAGFFFHSPKLNVYF